MSKQRTYGLIAEFLRLLAALVAGLAGGQIPLS